MAPIYIYILQNSSKCFGSGAPFVMAGLGPLFKPILVDTFIELLVDEVNKLKYKIVDNDDTFDDIPESDEDIIED